MMFFDCLCAVGVDTYNENLCDCVRLGSNRTSSRFDDIVGIRIGKDALEHFTSLGEPLLEEISRRRGTRDDPILQDLSDRYEDLERRFWAAMKHLGHDKVLVSREIITRGYRLEFSVMSSAALKHWGH